MLSPANPALTNCQVRPLITPWPRGANRAKAGWLRSMWVESQDGHLSLTGTVTVLPW